MRARPRWIRAAWALPGLLIAAAGCSEEGGTRAGTGPDGLTQQGWASFEQGRAQEALTSFEAALAQDDDYGPAHLGVGWALLIQAGGEDDFRAAAGSFGAALAAGEAGSELYGGRAAARLGAGDPDLAGAVSDAWTARTLEPGFVFVHWSGFDAADLHLVEAFAQAARGRYSEALAAADALEPSGIDASKPITWVVGGRSYARYAHAVLAHLEQLAELECGEGPDGARR
jgi:tetratricopeptide (TPR) repeat protein